MLSSYFNHIYCINLDTRKDRWKEVCKEFEKVEILDIVKRFVAIDGNEVDKKDLSLFPKNSSDKNSICSFLYFTAIESFIRIFSNVTEMSNGEIGCLLSHIEIVKEAKNKNFENVLVFEDDVVFCDDFNTRLTEFMRHVPSDWDMIYLGGNHNFHNGNISKEINEYVVKCNKTFTTHAIAIRKSIYHHILSINLLAKPIDLFYVEIQENYNVYAPCNSIAFQRVGYSDIQKCEVDYKDWIK